MGGAAPRESMQALEPDVADRSSQVVLGKERTSGDGLGTALSLST